MNYHKARELKDHSGWAWTTRNDDQIWTGESCMDGPHVHATREEAERCFYDHEAQHLREFTSSNAQYRCEYPSCGEWTQKGLDSNLLGQAILCDAHRSPDGWMAARPFTPGIEIQASW